MRRTLAIMFTITTYGTWLRGDRRGWVDQGRVLPPDPPFEAADRRRMKHPVFLFDQDQWLKVGSFIGESLRRRLDLRILAMTVQSWHVHWVTAATEHLVPKVVKCAKDAVRWGLPPAGRFGATGTTNGSALTMHRSVARSPTSNVTTPATVGLRSRGISSNPFSPRRTRDI